MMKINNVTTKLQKQLVLEDMAMGKVWRSMTTLEFLKDLGTTVLKL